MTKAFVMSISFLRGKLHEKSAWGTNEAILVAPKWSRPCEASLVGLASWGRPRLACMRLAWGLHEACMDRSMKQVGLTRPQGWFERGLARPRASLAWGQPRADRPGWQH